MVAGCDAAAVGERVEGDQLSAGGFDLEQAHAAAAGLKPRADARCERFFGEGRRVISELIDARAPFAAAGDAMESVDDSETR